MGSLNTEQKELLVSYYFNCCSESQKLEIENLISEEPEALKIYRGLERHIGVLDHLSDEKCPDYLVEITMNRFNEMTSSQRRLENLLKAQSDSTFKSSGLLNSFAKVAAIAAMVVVVAAVYYPATCHMRSISMRNACQDNLRSVASSIASYANDNQGMMPMVQISEGTPWWQVGSQDDASHSNTRNLWLLVKNGYAKMDDFICPAAQKCTSNQLSTIQISDFRRDFPNKNFIDYSFRVANGTPVRYDRMGSVILAADSNPLFENSCDARMSKFRRIILNEELVKIPSRNHNGSGQNVMFADGSTSFCSDRNYANDDIYTIKNTSEYSGIELPVYNNDVFLAP